MIKYSAQFPALPREASSLKDCYGQSEEPVKADVELAYEKHHLPGSPTSNFKYNDSRLKFALGLHPTQECVDSFLWLYSMTTPTAELKSLQEAVWNGSLPLEIRLVSSECRVYDQADPYIIQCHRLSYLPFLLPKLHAFFRSSLIDTEVSPHNGWFSFEGVPLKWHHPLGLLYDLFSGANPAEDLEDLLPWRLILHFTDWPEDHLVRIDIEGKALHDAFINSVKEADFLRNGNAKGIMTLSESDSRQLWKGVQDHDFGAFDPISQKLLHAQGASLRHVPLRIYLPSSPSASEPASGHLKVVQSLVAPMLPNSRENQTLGMALHSLLPSIFPSRRIPILARPILHGAALPMTTPVEELLRGAAYLDGWLHISVVMIG